MPGVVAVFTAADFSDDEMGTIPTDWTLPIMDGIPDRYPLARDAVKYVGEAVAVVIAETRAQADDAAYFVDVEYTERPAVVDTEAATHEGAPLVHDRYERNTSYVWHLGTGDWDAVAAAADHVVDVRLVNQRVHASSLEARVSIADYQVGTGTLTLYLGTQNVHVVRRNLSIAIGIPENRIRVVTPAVGGAFGSKLCLYPEDVIVSAVSRRLRRPVRWAETRAEHFTGTSGGRDHVEYVSLAADNQGKIQALKVTTYANLGAYVSGMGAGIPVVSGMVFPGVYDITVADVDIHGVFTNTSTTETYRGAGRPEAAYLIERAVDELAAKIGIDRVELRRRNFIQPHQFPYANATGMTYDSGDYEKALDKALDMIGWDGLLAEHEVARAQGRIVGLGLSVYTEFCGFGEAHQLQLVGFDRATWEQSVVTVTRTGSVIVQVGIDAAGQGHETSIAQVVATELGLDIDDVEVLQGDTDIVHFGTGTFNSRSMSSAGSSAALAARKIMAKATRLAAHMLDTEDDDIVYKDGVFSVGPDGDRQREFRRGCRDRVARYRPPRGDGADAEGDRGIRPAGVHQSVRGAHRRSRDRPRHRRHRHRPLRRRRRLRQPDQPAARQRPDPGRRRTRHRSGAVRRSCLGRGRPADVDQLHAVRRPPRAPHAPPGNRPHHHALAGQPVGSQGCWRIGCDRFPTRGGERGHGCGAQTRRR